MKTILLLLMLSPIVSLGQTFKYKKYTQQQGLITLVSVTDTGNYKIRVKPEGGQYILFLEGDIHHCTGTSTRLHCGAFTVVKESDRVEIKRITLGKGTETIVYTK